MYVYRTNSEISRTLIASNSSCNTFITVNYLSLVKKRHIFSLNIKGNRLSQWRDDGER